MIAWWEPLLPVGMYGLALILWAYCRSISGM